MLSCNRASRARACLNGRPRGRAAFNICDLPTLLMTTPAGKSDLTLPVHEAFPALETAISRTNQVLLIAPPGAGKTTEAPLWLCDHVSGEIWVIEPRRVAAREAATWVAGRIGEAPGSSIGYAVRAENRSGSRVTYMTTGIYLQRLQADPELSGVSAVLFDEAHERGLDLDLAFALTLDCQSGLREDLALMILTATPDIDDFRRVMPGLEIVESEGRRYPVDVSYLPDATPAQAILQALNTYSKPGDGDVLAFFPGLPEIGFTHRALEQLALPPDVKVHVLNGSAPLSLQAGAIAPCPPGQRKVVLSTNVAESSVTVSGVTVVIDTGLEKRLKQEHRRAAGRLETVLTSQASMVQRAGRAGRQRAGHCIRLWEERQNGARPKKHRPEIITADLTALALSLLQWGVKDFTALAWLTPPYINAMDIARERLLQFGLCTEPGDLTAEGRMAARLPLPPGLAAIALQGLSEPDLARLLALADYGGLAKTGGTFTGQQPLDHHRRQAKQIMKRLSRDLPGRALSPAQAIACARPDLIGKTDRDGWFRLAGGETARLWHETSPLKGADFLAAAQVRISQRGELLIDAAEAMTEADLRAWFGGSIGWRTSVDWPDKADRWEARQAECFRELVLKTGNPARPAADVLVPVVARKLRAISWRALTHPPTASLFRRLAIVAPQDALFDGPEELLEQLEDTPAIAERLAKVRTLDDLTGIRLADVLPQAIGWAETAQLDMLLPPAFTLPTGRSVPIDYSQDPPAASAKLQELFGLTESPRLMNGQLPLRLELLSPGGRPLAVTADLAFFWANAYRDVAKEMRGRYPKHPWPDDPAGATATAKTKRALARG